MCSSDLHQQLVARGVAVAVVDRLEVVQVQVQQRSVVAPAAALAQRQAQPVLEQAAVGQPGEGVHVGQLTHLLLERTVAVKLIASDMRAVSDRMLREARALARVRHAAVVEVFDCGNMNEEQFKWACSLATKCVIARAAITSLETMR